MQLEKYTQEVYHKIIFSISFVTLCDKLLSTLVDSLNTILALLTRLGQTLASTCDPMIPWQYSYWDHSKLEK